MLNCAKDLPTSKLHVPILTYTQIPNYIQSDFTISQSYKDIKGSGFNSLVRNLSKDQNRKVS